MNTAALRLAVGATLELRCTGLALGGRGVCRVDDSRFVVFVPGALPGETVSARVTRLRDRYGEAALVCVLSPSATRVEPACPLFGSCGGCSLQHLLYDSQVASKTQHVHDALQRIGGFSAPAVLPALRSPQALGYRNKVEFTIAPSSHAGKPPLVGLLRAGSEADVVDVPSCALQHPEADAVLGTLRSWLALNAASLPAGLLRRVMLRSSRGADAAVQLQVDLLTEQPPAAPPHPGVAALARHLRQRHATICSLVNTHAPPPPPPPGGHAGARRRAPPPPPPAREATRLLEGEPTLPMQLGGIDFSVSSRSFFQVNGTGGAEALLAAVAAAAALPAAGSPAVLDLFCGTGALSLPLLAGGPPGTTLLGVDLSAAAVADATAAAAAAGLAGRAKFRVADLGAAAPLAADAAGRPWDLVLVDPARAGMAPALLTFLRGCAAARLVYVSCDPATQARDLHALCQQPGGWVLGAVQPVDLFPQTSHVESVATLTRGDQAAKGRNGTPACGPLC